MNAENQIVTAAEQQISDAQSADALPSDASRSDVASAADTHSLSDSLIHNSLSPSPCKPCNDVTHVTSLPHDLIPAPPHLTDPDGPARRSRSKISRLPKTVRDQLNLLILDGIPYAEIPARLGDIAKDINEDNLSTWKTGGHQEWLKEQQRVEDCRISQELTLDLAMERQGIDSFQAPNKIAAALICEALADLGSETFRKAIAANPLNALRMLNTLSRLTVGGLKCERHLADEAERKARLDHSRGPNKKKGGI